MPSRLRLSWGMKTLKLFLLSVLESLEFGWQVIRYALIFVSAFFRQRASLGCEMVAMRSQLTFYKESVRQQRQPRPRFHPAFRLLWVLLSRVWTGWKSAAELMKPKTVLQWHEHAFLQWWRWKSRRKGGRPIIRSGNASVDPTFESRECPVECRNHPWPFGATRFRSTLPRHHQEVYGQASGRNGQVPNLVDLPAKSPASVMGHGLLHGSYSAR